jgi:hypothetical protein
MARKEISVVRQLLLFLNSLYLYVDVSFYPNVINEANMIIYFTSYKMQQKDH